MGDVTQQLHDTLGAEAVLLQEPMSAHTTFRTGGAVDYFLVPKSVAMIKDAISILREHEIPYFILGNGSNLLVKDGGILGAVIHVGAQMSTMEVDGESIKAQGGVLLSALSAKALEHGLTGLAFASGIPGTLGGAIVMNAGAYGGEMKDVLVSVVVLTPELEVKTLSVAELELSYRHSVIPQNGYLLLEATLHLKKGDKKGIQQTMAELAGKRREKQPLQYPSAGSTFKRPEGYFAGKLIEDAGLKGRRVGGAEVSEKHAGFVINKGGATTKDILDLIALCQEEVFTRFGVHLETEVKVIGRD